MTTEAGSLPATWQQQRDLVLAAMEDSKCEQALRILRGQLYCSFKQPTTPPSVHSRFSALALRTRILNVYLHMHPIPIAQLVQPTLVDTQCKGGTTDQPKERLNEQLQLMQPWSFANFKLEFPMTWFAHLSNYTHRCVYSTIHLRLAHELTHSSDFDALGT